MKFFHRALAIGTAALVGCGGSAFAAENVEAPGIQVQLNGQTLSFTDAQPMARDGRTFLPFRAVFEAMGAEVSYAASAQTITAVRDGISVEMALNGKIARITENGVSRDVTMDVAPFAENNRTYVPVRFAAQALGCSVGWDGDQQTVVLFEPKRLVEEAKQGKSYTYLQKYMDYAQKYQTGIWDSKMTFDGNISLAQIPLMFNGTVDATSQDSTKADLDMNVKMDLAQLITAVSEGEALSAEDQAIMDAIKNTGLNLSIRGDLDTWNFYLNMGSEDATIMQAAGLDPSIWYSLELGSLFETTLNSSMDLTSLMEASKSADLWGMVESMTSLMDVNDATAYPQAKAFVDTFATLLADESFTIPEGSRNPVLNLSLDEDGVKLDAKMELVCLEDGTVDGYQMDMNLGAMDSENPAESITMAISASMIEDGQMQMSLKMDIAGALGMDMKMNGNYLPGTKAPETTPPAGATIKPLLDLAGLSGME